MIPKSDALTFYRGAARRWDELVHAAAESEVTGGEAVVQERRAAAEAEATRVAEQLGVWRRPGEGGADPYAVVAAEIDHIPGDIWVERAGPAIEAVDRIAALLREARDELEAMGVSVEE
jgi:hypothetical protein